ncbi:MAG: cytochrome c oxidase subunit [Sphingomonadales bacterium]|jgi:cytochrome c oxidase subunit 2|nr:cytochrome c oxidase subunit [Sphingomonadales bacterium]MEA3043484.1 cytochrome c oxidase subunit [Sphingomonadales bacterium]
MKTFLKLVAIAAAFGLAPAAVAAAPALASTSNAAAPAGAGNSSAAAPLPAAPPATAPTPGIGQPDGRMGLQDQVSPIGQEALWFHNMILMPLITIICLFVLGLLAWVMFRYRRGANPTPSRNTHNTTLEIVWTLVPVLILVAIAVPSIRLLAHQYDPPRADLTVKAIGNQWFWEYQYPDMGISLVSNMLEDDQARARGEPRQLAVNNRLVVPVGAVVKMIVTSNDVIHAWGVPAFWTKIDAVPGRLNETWFRADRPGVYYGVCYELCGVRHGYMPIAVEVVSQAQFAQWVASKGGHMPGAAPAAAPAAPAAAPATGNTVAATETPATTNQSATR